MAIEAFKLPIMQGLKPENGMDYDLRYHDDIKNMYLTESGVFEAERFVRTAFGINNISAQIFATKDGKVYILTLNVGANSDTLYFWNGTSLTTLVSGIPSINRTNLWSCADFGKYIIFTNGATTLVKSASTGVFTINNSVIPISNWVCAHRGRLILASPNTTTFAPNLISCDRTTNLVYIHEGITNTVTSSFATPGTSILGLTYANGNLISTDSITDLVYIHDGITSSITSSFATPTTSTGALAFDGTNLISASDVTDFIYIHDGITSSITSSFAAPSSGTRAIVFDGTNLISASHTTNLIYVHDGITADILSSFAAPGTEIIDLAFDGANLISYDSGTSLMYIHDGITSRVSLSFAAPGTGQEYIVVGEDNLFSSSRSVSWSKINELTFQDISAPDMSNLAGHMSMEYPDDLLRVEPLKEHFIVYGESGISALTLAGKQGYGMTTLHHAGIKDVGSVCLNGVADGVTAHYFIDTSGELYVIDASLKVTRLGYKNEITTRHTADAGLISMSYNIRRDEVLINFYNSGNTLVYGKYGMTTITSNIYALVEKDGTRYVHSPAAIVQNDTYFRTNIFDMGYEGQKYLRGFSANIAIPQTVNIQIKYRTTRTGACTTTSAVAFDKASGYFNAGMLQGVEFQIIMDASNTAYTNVKIEDIIVQYSKINKRFGS